MNSRVIGFFLGLGLGFGQTSFASEASVVGVFCGSSPCGEAIRQVLQIPTNGAPDIIEWKLTLYQDPKTQAPSRYELRCDYGSTAPNQPGLAKGRKTLERQGTWTTGKGTKSNPDATVYELNGAVSFLQVDANVLQVLNADRSLMNGTGGWSYTLNRMEHAEKSVERELVLSQPDMSYQISPLAMGPTVFAVFEGRTPCHGIARELKKSMHEGCNKVKWRVTLYQNAETLAPTTYKVEGSLHRREAREGDWNVIQTDSNATIYRLAATKTEPALFLLKGDDNVVFFLDQNQNPLVGNCDFSYTLNRRSASSQVAQRSE
jgi:hypothetical protein